MCNLRIESNSDELLNGGRLRGRRWSWVTLLLLPMLTGWGGSAVCQAQELPGESLRGIVTEGNGETKAVPDAVEIILRLAAKGELTDDAVIKHRDARKRTLEVLQSLKMDNLKIEERELTLRPGNAQEMAMMRWNGMPPASNKRISVEVASALKTRLVGIDKQTPEEIIAAIGKLLDAAQDAGVALSDSDNMMPYYYRQQNSSSLVKFVVSDITASREKAYAKAAADAKQRAERLARLHGVKLGPVLAVTESQNMAGMQQRWNPYFGGFEPQGSEESDVQEAVAETLQGIRIQIKLNVRYSILPLEAKAAQAAPAGAEAADRAASR